MARSSLIPGFRFHPTDVELVMFYLKKKLLGKKVSYNVVAEVNIYEFCPWDLPDKSCLKSGDLEWYFFCPKARKYASGGRSNRATETGFWKATGKDRIVKYKERTVATIKTLVFHLGQAGNGQRTDWVMHEYRMEDEQLARTGIAQDAYVLCRIFEKSGAGPKNGAQYGAPFNEDEWDDDLANGSDSLAIVGPVGTSNKKDHKQKGPAVENLTEPGSSVVTFSANESTNILDYKKKAPAITNITEPGSSNTLNSPATSNMTGPCSSFDTLNYKQKGPATFTEPSSSSVTLLSTNETPVNDDVMFLEDFNLIMGDANGEKAKSMAVNDGFYDELNKLIDLDEKAKSMAHNENDGFYDELDKLIDLDEYTLAELLGSDDPDLGKFNVG